MYSSRHNPCRTDKSVGSRRHSEAALSAVVANALCISCTCTKQQQGVYMDNQVVGRKIPWSFFMLVL